MMQGSKEQERTVNSSGCRICPRSCGALRENGERGICGVTDRLKAARAALHLWEEPCISGQSGSGAVFFSGCSLRCIYCQNRDIGLGHAGRELTKERLAEIFLELQGQGACNINLVTAGHYVPQVVQALQLAKKNGLRIPVVYNSSGYEMPETLRLLEGLVDVYLPDFKYMDSRLAAAYSHAPDYPEIAKAAVAEMVRQTGPTVFGEDGMILKGVIVRHLLLPGHVKNAKSVVEYLHKTYGSSIYLSLMSQYTPMPELADHPTLGRRVTRREYEKLLAFALEIGVENGFYQSRDVAKDSFIPAFDGEGI